MTSRLSSALSATFFSNVLVGTLNLSVQIILARSLGIEVIADYAKIVAVSQFFLLFTSFGLNHALIGVGYSIRGFYNLVYLTAIQLSLIAAVWAIVAVYFFVNYPSEFLHLAIPASLYVIGAVALIPAHSLNAGLEAKLNYQKISLMRLASFGAGAVASLAALTVTSSVLAIVIRDVTNGMTFLALSFILFRGTLRCRIDAKLAKRILSFSRQLWLIRGSSEGASRINALLLGALLNNFEFGIYFQMRSLVDGLLTFFLVPIQSVLFSYFRMKREAINFRFLAAILFPVACLLTTISAIFFHFFGEVILETALGKHWLPGTVTLVPLAMYAVAIIYFEVLVSMAQASGNIWPVLVARISWISAVLLLVPPLTVWATLNGAAWAAMFSAWIMLAVGATLLLPRLQRKSLG